MQYKALYCDLTGVFALEVQRCIMESFRKGKARILLHLMRGQSYKEL